MVRARRGESCGATAAPGTEGWWGGITTCSHASRSAWSYSKGVAGRRSATHAPVASSCSVVSRGQKRHPPRAADRASVSCAPTTGERGEGGRGGGRGERVSSSGSFVGDESRSPAACVRGDCRTRGGQLRPSRPFRRREGGEGGRGRVGSAGLRGQEGRGGSAHQVGEGGVGHGLQALGEAEAARAAVLERGAAEHLEASAHRLGHREQRLWGAGGGGGGGGGRVEGGQVRAGWRAGWWGGVGGRGS